ncbi:MAG: metallopeptidase TldD-related protein [Candidatus Hodarchaeales archaeon]
MVKEKLQNKEGIAHKALTIARQQGINNIEIFIQSSDIIQFACGSAVHIAGRRFYEQGIAIRILVNGNLGFVCGTAPGNLEKMIRNANYQARVQTSNDKNYGKAFPAEKELDHKDPSLSNIISITREDLEGIANEMTESTKLDPLAKTVESTAARTIEERLIVNSEGLVRDVKDAWITASNQTIVRRPTGEIGFGFECIRTRDLKSFDPIRIGSRSYASAMILSNGIQISNREQERLMRARRILWHPSALSQLLAYTLVPAIVRISQASPEMNQDNKIEELPFPSTFSVLDDPTKQGLIPSYAFDDEGTSTKKKTLISDGKIISRLSDYHPQIPDSGGNSYRVQYFSERFRSFRYSPTLSPAHLVLEYSKRKSSTNLVDQCSGVTVMVKRVIGAHVASPTTGDFAIDVVEGYLVHDRQIRYPIRKMSIAGNIYHLLKAVRVVGAMETEQPFPSPFAITSPFILTEKSGSLSF